MKLYRAIRTNLISQGFGPKYTKKSLLPFYNSIGLRAHNGTDFVLKRGEKIYWDCDVRGTVWKMSTDPKAGIGVSIITDDKDGRMKHIFWHLLENGIKCKLGQVLETGDLIGLGDSTGMSTGDHLHRGLKRVDENNKTLNHGNGYWGAIDMSPFFSNIFVKDYMSTLKKKVALLQSIIAVVKKLLKLL